MYVRRVPGAVGRSDRAAVVMRDSSRSRSSEASTALQFFVSFLFPIRRVCFTVRTKKPQKKKKYAFFVVARLFWGCLYVVCRTRRINNAIAAARKALTTVGPVGVLRFTTIFFPFTNGP